MKLWNPTHESVQIRFFSLFVLYYGNKQKHKMETGQVVALCVVGLLFVVKLLLLNNVGKPRG